MAVRMFTATIHKEDDLYVAFCPEIGVVSQGLTLDGALANLKEATRCYLKDFPMAAIADVTLATFEVEYPA
jgi:predicted RNase H-like HicB family nuclease